MPAGVQVLPLHGAEPLAVHAITRLDDRRSEVALAVGVLAELFADWGRGSPDTPAAGGLAGRPPRADAKAQPQDAPVAAAVDRDVS